MTIPAGTYAGQTEDIVTTSLPVVAYTTTQMDDDTAYALTKTFWESKAKMADSAPWWDGVDAGLMANIDGQDPSRRGPLLQGSGHRPDRRADVSADRRATGRSRVHGMALRPNRHFSESTRDGAYFPRVVLRQPSG